MLRDQRHFAVETTVTETMHAGADCQPRNERFAQLIAAGWTQSAAFRDVWPHAREWKPESVHTAASRKAAKVAPRVAVISAEAAAQAGVALQDMIRQADLDHAVARACRNASAAIKATTLKAKLCGLLGGGEAQRREANEKALVDLLGMLDGLDRQAGQTPPRGRTPQGPQSARSGRV